MVVGFGPHGMGTKIGPCLARPSVIFSLGKILHFFIYMSVVGQPPYQMVSMKKICAVINVCALLSCMFKLSMRRVNNS